MISAKETYTMSFIYAEKSKIENYGETINLTQIYSDTKTKLIGAYKKNWSKEARVMINKYGFAKTINVCPNFSVSFAGNDTGYAHVFLEWLYSVPNFTEEEAINKAFTIHNSTNKNDIEFILCYADDKNETHIACIKERNIHRDCSSAWIGSYSAFCTLQKLRTGPVTTFDHFRTAAEECKDDSVGGFIICDIYNESEARFMFNERLEASADRIQIVPPNGIIEFSRLSETGDCTMHYISDFNDVIIEFLQNKTTIVYSNRYRYTEEDKNNPHTNRFLLPMIFDSTTGKPLEIKCSE